MQPGRVEVGWLELRLLLPMASLVASPPLVEPVLPLLPLLESPVPPLHTTASTVETRSVATSSDETKSVRVDARRHRRHGWLPHPVTQVSLVVE